MLRSTWIIKLCSSNTWLSYKYCYEGFHCLDCPITLCFEVFDIFLHKSEFPKRIPWIFPCPYLFVYYYCKLSWYFPYSLHLRASTFVFPSLTWDSLHLPWNFTCQYFICLLTRPFFYIRSLLAFTLISPVHILGFPCLQRICLLSYTLGSLFLSPYNKSLYFSITYLRM